MVTYTQILQSLPCTCKDLVTDIYTPDLDLYNKVQLLLDQNCVYHIHEAVVFATDHLWWNRFLGTKIVAMTGEMPSITPRQVRLELISRGLLTQVEQYLQSANDPALMVEWEYTTSFKINHPMVVAIGTALSLNLVDFFESALSRT